MYTVDYEAIKQARLKRLISKGELARISGIYTSTITRLEDGYDVRMVVLRKIILALGGKNDD
jgi:predicted transcriptional regulator